MNTPDTALPALDAAPPYLGAVPVAANGAGTYEATPEQALAVLSRFEGSVLVDLDETLYLRNSTEDFLDCAVPGLLALLLLRLLDLVKPWRWSGGERTRDVWRVRTILLLMPWTLRRWRDRVPELAAAQGNQPLLAQLCARRDVPIIATIGFTPIVTPLVAALGLPDARIISARCDVFADRLRGKLELVRDVLDAQTIRASLFISDSAEDLPLLDSCGHALYTVWPQARFRPALARIYLPGQYLTQVKRPGERYIVRGILQEDFAFWWLSSLLLAAAPVTHTLGLLFLLLSFWAIYERGYVDNDEVGARYEKNPKLSAAFHEAPVATPRLQPWLWAFGAGALAILLLRWPGQAGAGDVLSWAAVLLGTYAWFMLYNRMDKQSRVWMFSGLQFARTGAFAVLVAVEPIAIAALGAHVLARWLPYYMYRYGSKDWPESPFYLTRLLFFVVLAAMLALLHGSAALFTPTAAALLAWNLFRARRELRSALAAAHRIDRPRA